MVDAIKANGPATCVDTRGNAVGILDRFDDTTRPSAGKNLVLFVPLIDGGPHDVDLGGIPGPFPMDPGLGCAPNPAIVNFGPVVRGDIVVRDTHPRR